MGSASGIADEARGPGVLAIKRVDPLARPDPPPQQSADETDVPKSSSQAAEGDYGARLASTSLTRRADVASYRADASLPPLVRGRTDVHERDLRARQGLEVRQVVLLVPKPLAVRPDDVCYAHGDTLGDGTPRLVIGGSLAAQPDAAPQQLDD